MKKITLAIAAIAAAFTMNAQSDCANAAAISVSDDATVTQNVTDISGTAPSTTCNPSFYDNTEISAGAWYSYTAGNNDVVVTIFADVPTDLSTQYVPSFSIFSGTCGNLSCAGGSLITSQNQQNQPAEASFLAEAGETFYIVFDNYYTTAGLGVNASFDFDVTTSTNVPATPGAATTPTPVDGATDVAISTVDNNGDGNPDNAVAFSWAQATTGGTPDEYIFLLGDQDDLAALNPLGATANTSVNITGMEEGTEYFWAVVPSNVAGTPAQNDIQVWSFTTEGTASLEEVTANAFNHYLNNNVLTVESNSSIENVTIFNILGQQVATQKVAAQDAQVNVGSFKPGVYLAQVKVEGKVETFKFVKK